MPATKATQSGMVEVLGSSGALRRMLCAFLELPDIVNLCNTCGIVIQDAQRHPKGDLCTTLALTIERQKYRDSGFMDRIQGFRALNYLELHVPKHCPEKSQVPYKDLINRNRHSLEKLKITTSRYLNGEYDTMLNLLPCIGSFPELKNLEAPMELLPSLFLGRLTSLRKLTLTGSIAIAGAEALACAFGSLDNLEEIHTVSNLAVLEALIKLREEATATNAFRTVLEDDGTPFGNVFNTNHEFEVRLTAIGEDLPACIESVDCSTPAAYQPRASTPTSLQISGASCMSTPAISPKGLSHPWSRSVSPVTLEKVTPPYCIYGITAPNTIINHGTCSRLRVLRLEKFGNGHLFEVGAGGRLSTAIERIIHLYPQVEVECVSLHVVLRDPEDVPNASFDDLVARLAPKTQHLHLSCLSPNASFDRFNEDDLEAPMIFNELRSISLGPDRSDDGVCSRWLCRQVISHDTSGTTNFRLNLPVSDRTLTDLITSTFFLRIPRFTLHLSDCFGQECMNTWLRCFRRIMTSPTVLHNMEGLILGGIREHQMALVCLAALQSQRELKSVKNIRVSSAAEAEECNGVATPRNHRHSMSDLAMQMIKCNIGEVIDAPLGPVPSTNLHHQSQPKVSELGRRCGPQIDDFDLSPCVCCGDVDDDADDNSGSNGFSPSRLRRSILHQSSSPFSASRSPKRSECSAEEVSTIGSAAPHWKWLQLRLPVESLEWCLIFVDLHPQIENIIFISPSSAFHPRTQTDDVRRVLALLSKAMERRGFEQAYKREIVTEYELVHIGVSDGSPTTALCYSRPLSCAAPTSDNEGPGSQSKLRLNVLNSNDEQRPSPHMPSAEKVATIPLVAFFKKVKALEFQLLNLLDLYAEDFLPLLTARSKEDLSSHVMDRIKWFFRRTQLVRTTLASTRELQKLILQRAFPDKFPEAAKWIDQLVQSQPVGSSTATGDESEECSSCKPDFDWFARKATKFPPFSSKVRWLLDRYKELALAYETGIEDDASFESALQLPAYVTARGHPMALPEQYFQWIFDILAKGFQRNDICGYRLKRPSGIFLRDVSKDEATRWCVEHLVKHRDLVVSLLQRATKTESVAGMKGSFFTTRVSTNGPQTESECWVDFPFSIPSTFKSDVNTHHDVEWIQTENADHSSYRAVLKANASVRFMSKSCKEKEPFCPSKFDAVPPSPRQVWDPQDMPKHAPFVVKVHGLDPRMTDEDVYDVFAPSVKPYDVTSLHSVSTDCLEAIVQFGSRSHLGRALLYFHGSEYIYTPRWPSSASPRILQILLSLPSRENSRPVNVNNEL